MPYSVSLMTGITLNPDPQLGNFWATLTKNKKAVGIADGDSKRSCPTALSNSLRHFPVSLRREKVISANHCVMPRNKGKSASRAFVGSNPVPPYERQAVERNRQRKHRSTS